jgi:arylsulfatase
LSAKRSRLLGSGSARDRRLAGALVAALAAALATGADAAPLPITHGAGVTRGPLAAHGTTRVGIAATPPATFRANLESVPADARLLTAIAVADGPPDRPATPIRFRIAFEADGAITPLYERVLDGGDRRDRRWVDVGVGLAPLAGRRGALRFEATPAPADGTSGSPAASVPAALWAPPELAVCSGDAPSLLLITIDALRADHLGSAGYARPTTPYLDAFARDATRFTRAFTGGPKTIPSIPQILTGNWFYWHRPALGLADLLGTDGMPSRAIVNNPYVATWLRGEQPTFDAIQAGDDLDARAITSAALRRLTAAGRCPTTLYLHFLDTHTPYRAPARYARRFVDRKATTTIGLTYDDVTRAWQDGYGEADRQRIVDLYDGNILYTDRQIGRLLRGVARRGRLDHTLVIVTADHGEEFWDHRKFFHGQSLYDELLHVPLLVRFPDVGRGRVVEDVVRTVDLVPTIAEAFGRPPPTAGDGRSLRPLAAGTATDADRTRVAFALVSHAEPRTPERQAVRTATAKLIRDVYDGALEVYDLVADPREKRNLGPAAPGAGDLVRTLDGIRAQLDGKGHQLRLRGRADRAVRYVVNVASDPPMPLIALDRLSLERGDLVDFKPRASAFSVTGTLDPGDEDHVRFDVLAAAGVLKVTLRLDGEPAPDESVRLGAAGTASGPLVDLTDPRLDGAPRDVPAADVVAVELWRASAVAKARPATTLDDATRERLRQLGYVE